MLSGGQHLGFFKPEYLPMRRGFDIVTNSGYIQTLKAREAANALRDQSDAASLVRLAL